jgi:hypothetical protein
MSKKASAENSVKVIKKAKPRGKPFGKGNAFAFKAGVSGNPGGAPKGERLETTIARYMERDAAEVARLMEIATVDGKSMKGITFQEAFVLRTLAAFYNDPNGNFFQTLRDTKEGKLTEKLGGDEAAPFKILVEYVKRSNSVDGVASSTAED